jgi:hypothetical protein
MRRSWTGFFKAMSPITSLFRNILLWTYGRGTWQYDVMCALILAFIFLIPPSFFHENRGFHPKNLSSPTSQPSAPQAPYPPPAADSTREARPKIQP